MSFLDRLTRHIDLMPRMASRLGIDWAQRIQRDPGAAVQYREAVLRCAQCDQGGTCRNWLENNYSATQTPDYCRNKALLEELRPN